MCQSVRLDVVYLVVRYHVMRSTIYRNAHGLLDESAGTERIAVDRRSNERALKCFILIRWSRARLSVFVERLGRSCGVLHFVAFLLGFAMEAAMFPFPDSLLFTRREGLV